VPHPNSPEKDTGPAEIDITRPHPARTWDYYLGGKDNFAADRAVADQVIAAWPGMRVSARENRKFIGRAIHYLAGEAGIDQFLDIGSGLPTASNVHEVAQAINPAARVVYVDNDPLVLVHARALLTSSPEGRCAYIQADLREPEKILSAAATQETLDFTRPIALILAAVVHFLLPEDEPARIIKTLVDALPSGSYVVASHGSAEYGTQEEADVIVRLITASGVRVATRDSTDFGNLVFDGLSLVAPGVVLLPEWRPNPNGGPRPGAREVGSNAGVARKP
jgi:O-methyltransferase involved in polyketide biosynthesis